MAWRRVEGKISAQTTGLRYRHCNAFVAVCKYVADKIHAKRIILFDRVFHKY